MIQLALLNLPGMLGDVVASALTDCPEVAVLPPTPEAELFSLAAGGHVDAIIGKWKAAEGATLAGSLLLANPRLVIVVMVTGPPEEFHLHTLSGCHRVGADVSARNLVEEIRSRARN